MMRRQTLEARTLLMTSLAALWLSCTWAAPAAAQEEGEVAASTPGSPPAWFVYRTERTVGEGTGAYEGYTDRLFAAGRYDLAAEDGALQVRATYRWIYVGERCEQGGVDRDVRVDPSTRLYAEQTDLDDYDGREREAPLATWTWIPPSTLPGQTVRVLERDFLVAPSETVWVAGRQVPAIVLRTRGEDHRDDAYGTFITSFEDAYWFHAETGYFLRSVYVEHDRGRSEGQPASFVWRETVEVMGASYLPGTSDEVARVARCPVYPWDPDGGPAAHDDLGTLLLVFGLGLAFAAVLAIVLLSRARRPITIAGREVKAVALETVDDFVPLAPQDSPHLAPFHRHLVDQALRAGEPVFEATLDDGRVVGLGIGDREGRIASIFAREGDACELLRKALGVTEFFTETRHEHLPSVLSAAKDAGRTETPRAYNVYETYEVLALRAPQPQPYDVELVRRMTDADLADVAALSMLVHGVRGERWLAAALATGELGFVARRDGALLGYAFASVVGSHGRLHGNTVHPEHRGQGVGKELTRARLSACAALGADLVITEVATHNVASLEVVRSLGFQSVGKLWVESAAAAREERRLLRR